LFSPSLRVSSEAVVERRSNHLSDSGSSVDGPVIMAAFLLLISALAALLSAFFAA
jgi:hypothetical protein